MSYFSDFKLLTKADAAAIFGVCTKTIDNYIRDGLLPAPTPFGSREYWHPDVFGAFLDRTFGTASAQCPPESVLANTSGESASSVRPRAPTGRQGKTSQVIDGAVSRQQARQSVLVHALNAAA